MIRNIYTRYVVPTFRKILYGLMWLALAVVLIAVAYFLSEPFAKFGRWYEENNVAPRAMVFVLAPLAAAAASQIRGNLVQQVKRREPKSIRRAFRQLLDSQPQELLLGWLTWLAFTSGAIALGQMIDLF